MPAKSVLTHDPNFKINNSIVYAYYTVFVLIYRFHTFGLSYIC